MRWKKSVLALVILGILVGGCLGKKEFNEYKAQIKVDGDSVDLWIEAAHAWFMWFGWNETLWCSQGGCVDFGRVGPIPSDPPPDGEWGG